MNKTLTRFNRAIISIGNLALMNRKYDFNNHIDYLKYIRLKRSKDLLNHFLNDDLYISNSEEEIKEILNKISYE